MLQKIKSNVHLNDIYSKQKFVHLTGDTKIVET